MGELKVGDCVFGRSGDPVRVVAATEVMRGRKCYRVKLKGCDPIVADSSHQWVVSVLGKERVVTTEWLFNCLSASSYCPTIRGPRPVICKNERPPIDPYVFGAWLGDGWSNSAAIICGAIDAEHMISEIALGEPVSSVQKYGYQSTFRISLAGGSEEKFTSRLRRVGAYGNKRIPRDYLRASVDDRLRLLQGIMDTDGCAKLKKSSTICTLVTKSDALCEGYSELLSSLGVVHSKKLRPVKSGPYSGKKYWIITFTPPAGMRVFSLQRKQSRLDSFRRKTPVSFWFDSVAECESVPVRCIQVDSPDGVFLAGKQFVPTHNSTLLSGIGLYTLVADGPEQAAECFGCATSREQAGIVYKQMKELVEASPYLSEMLEIVDSRKTIAYVPTHSFWKVISSDAGRQEGLNIHSLCYDEIHSAKDDRLWRAVRYGGISRAQSLILAITTAGVDRNSIGFELHEHAMKVRQDPSYDDQFFAYVAAAAPEDDYRDPEVWKAANPSWGVTMDEDSFRSDVREAEQSNSRLAAFLRYRLNVWTQGDGNKYIKLDQWDRCKGDSGILGADRIWYAGLDLAQTWDCNAFVAVSKASDGVFDVLCKFWIPGENAGVRSQKDGVPYTTWAKEERYGLTLTPGNTCDYDFIRRDILQFCKERTVRMIAVDPHNSHYLVQQLQAEGLNVSGFSQGFTSMNPGVRLLDTLIAQGRLRTNENPILNWMAGNATTKENSEGYVKVVKPSPTSPLRVDGIVALIMAIAVASDAENAKPAPEPEVLIL